MKFDYLNCPYYFRSQNLIHPQAHNRGQKKNNPHLALLMKINKNQEGFQRKMFSADNKHFDSRQQAQEKIMLNWCVEIVIKIELKYWNFLKENIIQQQ